MATSNSAVTMDQTANGKEQIAKAKKGIETGNEQITKAKEETLSANI